MKTCLAWTDDCHRVRTFNQWWLSIATCAAMYNIKSDSLAMIYALTMMIVCCRNLHGICYDSLSLPPLLLIAIGYTFPILFKSPFSISINKLFYFQPFYYSAFHYSAFLLFSLILLSLFIIQLYYSATFLLV